MKKYSLLFLGCIIGFQLIFCSAKETESDNCRTYAKTFVDDQATPETTSCEFSASTYQLTCTAGSTTTVNYYASTKDFIAEVNTIFLDKKTKITIDNGSTTTKTYTRNPEDQITEINDTTNVETYNSWDEKKRPVLGEYKYTDCDSAVLSIAYDESNKLFTQTYTGGTGAGCLSFYKQTITLDKNGNLTKKEIDNEGTITTRNYTISETTKICD